MNRPRVSLAGMMVVVALVAVAFIAFKDPLDVWASALFTLTTGTLAASVLVAVASRGRARVAWIGFALFGWLYLALSFHLLGMNGWDKGPPNLITEMAISHFGRTSPAGLTILRQISHSLAALLAAVIGFLVGYLISAREDTRE